MVYSSIGSANIVGPYLPLSIVDVLHNAHRKFADLAMHEMQSDDRVSLEPSVAEVKPPTLGIEKLEHPLHWLFVFLAQLLRHLFSFISRKLFTIFRLQFDDFHIAPYFKQALRRGPRLLSHVVQVTLDRRPLHDRGDNTTDASA